MRTRPLHRPRHRRRLRRVHGRRRALLLPDPRRLPRRAGGAAAVRGADRLQGAAHVRRRARLGFYGFGDAAHILTQIARWQGREVHRVHAPRRRARPGLRARARRRLGGLLGRGPPEPLDAAIIFAPVGALVPLALRRPRPGGTVVCGGIFMSDIPSFPYELLWEERERALGRQPHPPRRRGAAGAGSARGRCEPTSRRIRWRAPTRRSPICAPVASRGGRARALMPRRCRVSNALRVGLGTAGRPHEGPLISQDVGTIRHQVPWSCIVQSAKLGGDEERWRAQVQRRPSGCGVLRRRCGARCSASCSNVRATAEISPTDWPHASARLGGSTPTTSTGCWSSSRRRASRSLATSPSATTTAARISSTTRRRRPRRR